MERDIANTSQTIELYIQKKEHQNQWRKQIQEEHLLKYFKLEHTYLLSLISSNTHAQTFMRLK
jgi:hypothetical protein